MTDSVEIQRLMHTAQKRSGDLPSPAIPFGLAQHGVHEVTEAAYGDGGAITGFALSVLKSSRPGAWLWIHERKVTLDQGRITGLGSAVFGLNPSRFLFVETRTTLDALMAGEEGLRSGAVSLVISEVSEVNFTASRRLVLASERTATPAILLMPHTREGATAAHSRWRVAPAPSAPNRFDARAPGNPRWSARLERSRITPERVGQTFDLEFDYETLCMRLVSELVDRPATPRPAQSGHILPFRKAG